MMYDYDVINMVKVNSDWLCNSNTIQQRDLEEQQVMQLDRYRFLINPINETEVDIIVNRLDTDALTEATRFFFEQYK